ncbi:hypothetical protein SLE2022_195670 [Rubroshorea leprosula]
MTGTSAEQDTRFSNKQAKLLKSQKFALIQEVNGKEVQISLTGFMEKSTGKFMKEPWSLLLSAQKNVSGVPQQFLDAKEEESRKKKADADRITNEIQRMKDKASRDIDQERLRKMDGEVERKSTDAELQLSKVYSVHPDDERDADQRNGVRRRKSASGSSYSADCSPSFSQRSRSGSPSKLLILEAMRRVSLDHLNHDAVPFLWIG